MGLTSYQEKASSRFSNRQSQHNTGWDFSLCHPCGCFTDEDSSLHCTPSMHPHLNSELYQWVSQQPIQSSRSWIKHGHSGPRTATLDWKHGTHTGRFLWFDRHLCGMTRKELHEPPTVFFSKRLTFFFFCYFKTDPPLNRKFSIRFGNNVTLSPEEMLSPKPR